MRFPIAGALFASVLMASTAQAEPPLFSNPAPASPPAAETVPGLPGAANDRAIRARANLEALIAGRLSTADLSAEELQDVLDFERMVRGQGIDNRSPRQQCIDEEVRRNGGRPTRLAWEVIRLKCR